MLKFKSICRFAFVILMSAVIISGCYQRREENII